MLAPDVGPGEAEAVTQEVAQQKSRFDVRLASAAVDDDPKDHLKLRRGIVTETPFVPRFSHPVCRRGTRRTDGRGRPLQ
jgi:hypothetical protein